MAAFECLLIASSRVSKDTTLLKVNELEMISDKKDNVNFVFFIIYKVLFKDIKIKRVR
ncbi:hypothetical protein MUA31_12885 [Staphylococcus simulans]|uniref:hypothetical protein n=1 Tax=Staphylococcus simulans TaxID=1286 RepID=UPI0021CE3E81|nr:hypothetical protein [Staphylococcus simulans]UXR35242.1 hypothetical protein MUA31_12885 [Staphylococcus simulans]